MLRGQHPCQPIGVLDCVEVTGFARCPAIEHCFHHGCNVGETQPSGKEGGDRYFIGGVEGRRAVGVGGARLVGRAEPVGFVVDDQVARRGPRGREVPPQADGKWAREPKQPWCSSFTPRAPPGGRAARVDLFGVSSSRPRRRCDLCSSELSSSRPRRRRDSSPLNIHVAETPPRRAPVGSARRA